ncbi:MAG TPA: DUF1361 domain-containing protein [Flavisolibacter sp.]|jgi:uncharacterized membrane protein|nr:DUF1361 domain-containing protein [Flavisolibacter sp.]
MFARLEKNSFLQRIYFNKTELEQVLLLSCAFSVALSAARLLYTGRILFMSMNWNLFLAFIPYFMTRQLVRHPDWMENKGRFMLVFTVWLLFIPNAFYMLTDLFHLDLHPDIPLWFDLAFFLSFAWNGLLLGIISVRQMEKIVQVKWNTGSWLFAWPILFLNAFGIYLGRYLRYNSWDIVSNPFQLVNDCLYLLIHPIRNRFDWSMIICYTILLILIYTTLKKLSKAIW